MVADAKLAARHALEEHVGELKLRIEGPTPAELFAEAGRALTEAMGARAADGPLVTVRVGIHAVDGEVLLVDWLNELIFLSETEKVAFQEFRVELPSERELVAFVTGAKVERLRNPVKAATLHGLTVARRPEGFTATVILDL